MTDAVPPPPLLPDDLGPDTSPVAYETALDGALAYVTLNRPEYRNAQNSVMTYSLDSAFHKAVDDPNVKAIVLRANGKHFSAGHDIGTPERDFGVYYDNVAALHWDHTAPAGDSTTSMTADQRLARETLTALGFDHIRARLITGRALDVLPRLTEGAYDLVFIDGDRTEYPAALTLAKRLPAGAEVHLVSHSRGGLVGELLALSGCARVARV